MTQDRQIYAIGDIHGHYLLLKGLIQNIKPSEKDLTVFLGDYIDRGPRTKQAIEYLIVYRKKSPAFF